jgi:class 3 adenylate cyclase
MSDSRILQFPAINDRANRTFMCTVLFLDIVEYAKKMVAEQLKAKEQFNACISEAIQDVAVNDRIILDTGDGAAVNFLGDPEDALFVALKLSHAFSHASADGTPLAVRIGINLGPVRLVRDINSQPNIIGDGINVAHRVMSFARPGQVLVSRSYYDVVSHISGDYTGLFAYQGSRTDKHVREHEIYEVSAPAGEALELTRRRHTARPTGRPALADLTDPGAAAAEAGRPWSARRALPYAAAALSCIALIAAIAFFKFEPRHETAPVRVTRAPPPRPPKLVEAPPVQASTETPPPAPAPSPSSVEPAPQAATEVEKPEAHKPAPEPKPSQAHKRTRVSVAPAAKPAPHQEPAEPEARPTPPTDVTPWKPPTVTPAAAPPTPKAAAGPTALITFAVSPWGEVVVDGKRAGVSPPMTELELTPGAHRIEIRNGDFKPYLETLELEANQTIRIKHKFYNR